MKTTGAFGFLFLSIFLMNEVRANFAQDTLRAKMYFDIASKFHSETEYDSAAINFDRAMNDYGSNKIWHRFLESSVLKAHAVFRQDQIKEAINIIKQSLNKTDSVSFKDKSLESKFNQSKSNAHLRMAYSFRKLSKYDSAIFHFNMALSVHSKLNPSQRERILTGKAVTHWYLGNNHKAMEIQREALETLGINGDKNRRIISYNVLGLISGQLGQHHESIAYYNHARRIIEGLENGNEWLLARVINNLGIAFQKVNNYRKSQELYSKAYKMFLDLNASKSEKASMLNNLGNAHLGLENYDSAISYFNESLKIRHFLYGDKHDLVAEVYYNLGSSYESKEQFDQALKAFKLALKIRLEVLGRKSSHVARTYNRLGEVYLKSNQLKSSMSMLDSSILSNQIKRTSRMQFSTAHGWKENYLSIFDLIESLTIKATVHSKRFFRDLEKSNFHSALELYYQCDRILDQKRIDQFNHDDKIELSKYSEQVYEKAIILCWEAYLNDHDQTLLNHAFYFASKGKSSILKNAMLVSNQRDMSIIPDSLLEAQEQTQLELDRLKSEIAFLLNQETLDSTSLRLKRNEVFETNSKLDRIRRIELDNPIYYKLSNSIHELEVEEIQLNLEESETLIDYFIGDEILFAFVITKDTFLVKKLEKMVKLGNNIKSIRESLREENFEKFAELSYQLYTKLVLPLELVTEKLIIVPDNELWHLNFDLLLVDRPDEMDFKKCNYLIKEKKISYLYSSGLIEESKMISDNNSLECLGFSFTNLNNSPQERPVLNNYGLNPLDLPGSRKEVEAISKILDGEYYFDDHASEEMFKDRVKSFRMLHLAIHGELNDEDPFSSRLHFANKKDYTEDNYLYAFELFNSNLNLDMAVLSACNTGAGKLFTGEGIISFGWAFTAAGCKSVVLSHWELSDRLTPSLMKNFYENIKEGHSKSDALRIAKLSYLEDADNLTANPYFWAGLVSYGNDKPLLRRVGLEKTVLKVFMIALVILLIYRYKSKRAI